MISETAEHLGEIETTDSDKLAAGCSIVIKTAEQAPVPMLEFARPIDRAGFPPGVVSLHTGDAEDCAVPLARS